MTERTLTYHDPHALVQTDWLEAHLNDPHLRIFDCTTHLLPADATTDAPYRIVPGKAEDDQGHIPGAGFLDVQGELSDNTTKLRFMLPPAEQFASAMSRSAWVPEYHVLRRINGGMGARRIPADRKRLNAQIKKHPVSLDTHLRRHDETGGVASGIPLKVEISSKVVPLHPLRSVSRERLPSLRLGEMTVPIKWRRLALG